MKPNKAYYQIAVEGYAPCVISVSQLDDLSYWCVIENVYDVLEFEFFAFIVATSKDGDSAFKQYAKIPEDFMEKAWAQISDSLTFRIGQRGEETN